jgi:glyoxylase-like metal-dependent hydrolase (beta-lactamase superfamily II)
MCHDAQVATRVHHLSCGSMCPSVGRVGLVPPLMVTHCLLVEGDSGLTLVDTGFGTDDVAGGARRLGRVFTAAFGPRLDPSETALSQLTALGFRAADVHDVVLTHLDLDHAGGLADFPHARVHVHRAELDAALHPVLADRARYLQVQWGHGPDWVEHSAGGDDWLGFASTRVVADDVVLVPLHGHSRGHCGVAVRRPGGGWLLHAGDAYFHAGDLERPRRCPPVLRAFQRVAASDQGARRANLARLQELRADPPEEVTVFCAHDAAELDELRRTSA